MASEYFINHTIFRAGLTALNSDIKIAKYDDLNSTVYANSASWGAGGGGGALYQATYYKSVNQNLVNGSTDITFDQDASWNNDNGLITHSSGSADFTVVQAGLYQLEFNVLVNANGATWNTANSKIVSIDITRSPNAEQVVIGQTAVTSTTQNYTQSVVSTFRLEAGDKINLRVQGNYATATPFAQGVQNNIDLNTWFSWRFLASGSGGVDTEVRALTSNWQNTYTTVQSNSSTWGSGGGSGSDVTVLSGNWESTYTTVQSNSSDWSYQGTDIKNLTGNWVGGNDAFTNLVANSAAYLSAVNLSFLSVSANWNSVYSNVNANSATWSIITSYSSLIGDSMTNPITATHNLNTKDIVFSVREVATDKIIYTAGRAIDNNNIELTFNNTPSINQYDLTVLCNGGTTGTGGVVTDFAIINVTSNSYIQNAAYTHFLYDDTAAGGQITSYILPAVNHIGVTQHKKIGNTANVVLSAPPGTTLDGQTKYTLNNQYESVGVYTDGTNFFIQ